jgi:hypothetical protein
MGKLQYQAVNVQENLHLLWVLYKRKKKIDLTVNRGKTCVQKYQTLLQLLQEYLTGDQR